jgi:hypothetical protein
MSVLLKTGMTAPMSTPKGNNAKQTMAVFAILREENKRLQDLNADLLAALKRMEVADRKQAAGEIYDYSNAVLEARAAIAKAEGRSCKEAEVMNSVYDETTK